MKKFFSIIGIFTLAIVSFIYTNKTIEVAKQFDNVMTTINEISSDYYVDPIDGMIIDDVDFIPGISGHEVDCDKSYKSMRKYGGFNKNLLEYNEIKPKNKLEDNLDKYIISGNKNKSMVSLIFIVEDSNNIDKILSILENKNIKANFFIDGAWLEKNNEVLSEIVSKGHGIGNLSYNRNYQNSSFAWMDTIIKRLSHEKYGFCYSEEDNSDNLKLCAMNNNFTIKPSIIVKNYPLKEIKKSITNGSIISIPINKNVEQELSAVISYINSRGLEIVTLKELLKETI
ncbi:MAG: polysaccharide deacetylase family protein [Bacilli bacterium]|nr:polysaccharide deacetylase family protein [Bacilli bacterium]